MEDSEKNKLLAQNEIQEIQRQANGWNFNKPVNPYRKFFQEVVGIKKPLLPPEIVQGYAQSIKALKEFQLCTRQIHNAIEPEVQRILPAVNEILKNYKELTDEIRIFPVDSELYRLAIDYGSGALRRGKAKANRCFSTVGSIRLDHDSACKL